MTVGTRLSISLVIVLVFASCSRSKEAETPSHQPKPTPGPSTNEALRRQLEVMEKKVETYRAGLNSYRECEIKQEPDCRAPTF